MKGVELQIYLKYVSTLCVAPFELSLLTKPIGPFKENTPSRVSCSMTKAVMMRECTCGQYAAALS